MKLFLVIASAVSVLAVAGCGQPASGSTQAPPPNISNDAIVSGVLSYKVCPTAADTLELMAAKVLAQRNATVLGTGVFRRYGDQAQVAIAYEQQGSQAEATFTYNLGSGQVMGSNAIGQQILMTLSAECG